MSELTDYEQVGAMAEEEVLRVRLEKRLEKIRKQTIAGNAIKLAPSFIAHALEAATASVMKASYGSEQPVDTNALICGVIAKLSVGTVLAIAAEAGLSPEEIAP